MVDETGIEEELISVKEAPTKEISHKAQQVLDEFGVEVDWLEPATQLAMKNSWMWEVRGSFIACCRVKEKTEKLGLEVGEQVWTKIALGGEKGPERVKKEGAKLSGLRKITEADVNENVSVNLPELLLFGDSEETNLPLIVRRFVKGYLLFDGITDPDIIGPIAEEWHEWQKLVYPEGALNDEEQEFLVEVRSFGEQDEIFEGRLAEYIADAVKRDSGLARQVREMVAYPPAELRSIFLSYEEWYKAHPELKFRLDDCVPRNWVIDDDGKAWIVDHGSSRFGPEAMVMHDVAYKLMNV